MPLMPRNYAGELAIDSSKGPAPARHTTAMQIFFRDMNTATHHAMLDFDSNVEIQGKSLFGVELNDAMV